MTSLSDRNDGAEAVIQYRIVGLPRKIDHDAFEEHVERTLGGTVTKAEYFRSNQKRSVAHVQVRTAQKNGTRLLRKSIFEGVQLNVEEMPKNNDMTTRAMPKKDMPKSTKSSKKSATRSHAKNVASLFYDYLMEDASRLERASDREEAGVIFQNYLVERGLSNDSRLEALVMSILRQRKLMRSKRYGSKVILTFARGEPGDFPPEQEREDARDRVLRMMGEEEEDKHGVVVSKAQGLPDIVPVKESVTFEFQIDSADASVSLEEVTVLGPQKWAFKVQEPAFSVLLSQPYRIRIIFKSSGTGLYRGNIRMRFQQGDHPFDITRPVKVKSGDKAMDDLLKPTSPYKKRERRFKKPPKEVIPAPRPPKRKGYINPFALLPKHEIPSETRELIMSKELESILQKPDKDIALYTEFWKQLLWASEYQAYEDIKLYDMEGVRLKREGRWMALHVPGLAEGRPSVLRGDHVNVTWKGRTYKGLVNQTRLLEVLMELDYSFHEHFSESLDTVDIGFTFSRTTFRTSHEGCLKAPEHMGEHMLAPTREHWTIPFFRVVPTLQWANHNLNAEQQGAVTNIVKGGRRPLPYIVFGPPGTGKTTTVVEAVYQLIRHKDSLNVLLLAPSNDAADILVEKLSSYFPPSEMRRVIAYSRSIDQVPSAVKPYATDGLTDVHMGAEIRAGRIVVSTVNLAARFSFYGIPRGHFDVLCVDEAGHATEPEVVGVAASLMDFTRQDARVGQLILAGDPRQLGPVITSDLCRKFGLNVSYMERLCGTDVYSRGEKGYSSDLLTKLVRNYRSHSSILKLPNEMFYDNDLLTCGDILSTNSLARWEHLPKIGFPVVFHAVNGENLREGTSPSWFNPQEVEEAVNYVDLLVNQSRPAVKPVDIGIVTPYARQAQKIRLALKHRDFQDVKVGSVETFQGQERRCIIISTVRAENEFVSFDLIHNLGFVANEKRFNVAVTRAKALLVVIGCPEVLANDEKNWLPFLRYCKENGGWAGQAWDETDAEAVPSSNSDDWLLLSDVSQAVEQEGLGFINREE